MFSYLRNLFRKNAPAPKTGTYMVHGVGSMPKPTPLQGSGVGVAGPMPRVETAQLQLAAIMAKFPDELRKLVLKQPSPEAMVALPLPTIQKFLPTGSVKMSLASVVRQAPPGTFAAINTGDKRLVEVPLAEIFKRISPAVLKKRVDQRYTDLAAEGFDIFGDEENPHALAPRCDAPQEFTRMASGLNPSPVSSSQTARMQPPLGMGLVPPAGVGSGVRAVKPPPPFAVSKASTARIVPAADDETPRLHVGFNGGGTPTPPKQPEPPASDAPPLVLPLQDIAQTWPEPIKSEAIALNGTTVSIPSSYISLGLAKGKVAFAWGQLRSWMTPVPESPSEGAENQELLLPLRVIAPAFLKHTRQAQQRKSLTLDDSIPELFGPGREAPPPTPAEPEVQPAPAAAEPEAVTPAEVIPADVAPSDSPQLAEVPEEAPVAAPEPATIVAEAAPAAEEQAIVAEQSDAAPETVAPAPEIESTPATAAVPEAPKEYQTLGEAFGDPGKTNWSPSDIVTNLAKLPNVLGAAVALQEGLVIAHELPEPMKGEVFAAFLPQIFARLSQYAGEMKLGGIDDILVNSSNGPCHVFRRGQVYFAALGKVGEPLPGPLLRLCADALADQ